MFRSRCTLTARVCTGVSQLAVVATLTASDRARLGRRAQLLAATSVAYNLLEAVIAVTAGFVAGSIALVGFGLDSSNAGDCTRSQSALHRKTVRPPEKTPVKTAERSQIIGKIQQLVAQDLPVLPL